MPFHFIRAALAAALLAFPAVAQDGPIAVEDAYALAASPNAMSGAAFMVLVNRGEAEDRLLSVASDASERVELHTTTSDANGVMRMTKVEDGIAVPAGGSAELGRGGDHVMFMGLRRPFLEGETVSVTLTFETAGEISVEIPVDLTRQPGHEGHGATGN